MDYGYESQIFWAWGPSAGHYVHGMVAIEDEKGTFEASCVAVRADVQSKTALRA